MLIKKVVVPVTDIGMFRKTLPHMVEWMDKLSGAVEATLLYVADTRDVEAATPLLEDMRIKRAQLDELAEELERYGIRTKIKLKAGDAAKEIVKEAKGGAFAILVSTDGRGLSRILSAKAMEEVIRGAPCPVVVFKPRLLKFTDRLALSLSRIRRLSTAVPER
jgi:nucleotide-binding universal stress UspA family protein